MSVDPADWKTRLEQLLPSRFPSIGDISDDPQEALRDQGEAGFPHSFNSEPVWSRAGIVISLGDVQIVEFDPSLDRWAVTENGDLFDRWFFVGTDGILLEVEFGSLDTTELASVETPEHLVEILVALCSSDGDAGDGAEELARSRARFLNARTKA